jgi:general secretion pathway protein E
MSLFNFGRKETPPPQPAATTTSIQQLKDMTTFARQQIEASTGGSPSATRSSVQPLTGSKVPGDATGKSVVALPERTIVPMVKGGESHTPSSVGDVMYGPLLCSRDVIQTEEALVNVAFIRVINTEVQVAPWLFSKVAVVRVNENLKECSIFIDKEGASHDIVAELVLQLVNLQYKVLRGHFASSKLIMSLSQGHIDGSMLKTRREISRDPARSALFQEFQKIIAWAYDNKADDVDWALNVVEQYSQVCFKIGGRYIKPAQHRIKSETMSHMLGIAWQLTGGGSSAQFDAKIEQQAQITLELPAEKHRPDGARIRLRWSGMAIDKGTVVTMRLQRLGTSALVKSLESAGYLRTHMDIFNRVIRSEGGLVCFAGVVGSGKSTSLAQLLNKLPDYVKIQSIEDPVELEIKNAYQKTVARELMATGPDQAFLSAARAIYRSALDVLYLGEVRDTETGGIARQVVESGHTVFTTTHARSGLGVIERLTSPQIGVPRDVLGAPGIIKLLVFQALLPVNCPHCSVTPTQSIKSFGLTGEALIRHEEYWARVERLYKVPRDRYRLHDPRGCPHCRKEGLPELNGLNGRTVVCEMVEPDDDMEEMILEGHSNTLNRYWRSLSNGIYDSEDMTGKTAMECAIYKATLGLIDPREIEDRFTAFETIENKMLRAANRVKKPSLRNVRTSLSHEPEVEAEYA